MRDILQQQELLFNWIAHYGCRGIQDIRNACKELARGLKDNDKYCMYRYFYPLVRLGLLEYVGGDIYALSKPMVVFDHSGSFAVCINLPEGISQIFTKEFELVSKDYFGIIRVNCRRFRMEKFCQYHGISFCDLNLNGMLELFPSINHIVQKFEIVGMPSDAWYYDLENLIWNPNRLHNDVGVYRAGEQIYARKLLLDGDGTVYNIPSKRDNPDALHIALCYQAAITCCGYINFNKESSSLMVSKIQLPILLDRVLRIPSLMDPLVVDTVFDTKVKVYRHIPSNVFDQVKRILFLI